MHRQVLLYTGLLRRGFMDITLQPELEQFIREKITSGQYQSVNEAINAGLKLLMERELIFELYYSRY